ncbi:MAG: DegV family protein, partial [Oscillospiraceae bacterium]
MNIKITADSTCDLSADILTEYDITITPLTVIKAGPGYIDGVTITPAEIFAHVADGGKPLLHLRPQRRRPFRSTSRSKQANTTASFTLTSGADFSSTYHNACVAAADFPNVRVIDSRNLSTGQGHIVLKAAELAKTRPHLWMPAWKRELDDFTSRVEASFLVDRLDYMVKGGRCSTVVALGANLLNLKPCIEVKDGKMAVAKKYRGKYDKCLANYVEDRLDGRDDLDNGLLFVTHTPVTDECHAAVMEAVAKYGTGSTRWTKPTPDAPSPATAARGPWAFFSSGEN